MIYENLAFLKTHSTWTIESLESFKSNLQYAHLLLTFYHLLFIAFLLLILFFLSLKIKVDQLQKRQEICNKKYDY